MEGFFALLQRNVLDAKRWKSRDELRLGIVLRIDRTYDDRRRRQRALGKLTSVEYEAVNRECQPKWGQTPASYDEPFLSQSCPVFYQGETGEAFISEPNRIESVLGTRRISSQRRRL